jgi:hypothetical protein
MWDDLWLGGLLSYHPSYQPSWESMYLEQQMALRDHLKQAAAQAQAAYAAAQQYAGYFDPEYLKQAAEMRRREHMLSKNWLNAMLDVELGAGVPLLTITEENETP